MNKMNEPVQSAWADSTGQYQLYVASTFWCEDKWIAGQSRLKNVQATKAGMRRPVYEARLWTILSKQVF